jgi:F-type H+-transporting ATPase subunit delta
VTTVLTTVLSPYEKAVEAVPLEQLDADAVKKGLADFQAKLSNAKDDYEKASAQIGIEVCGAMNSALSGI